MSLADEVVELLQANGPMEVEFIRNRLTVASKARMDAAIFVAEQTSRIERCTGEGSHAYRIPGDTRPILMGDIHAQSKRRRAVAC